MNGRDPRLFPILLVLSLSLSLVAAPAVADGSAQEPASDPAPAADDATSEDSPALGRATSADERTFDEPSDAERLLRMQQVVAVDEAKLERLRTDLASRQEFLDQLTGRMATFQADSEEMQSRLEELEEEILSARSPTGPTTGPAP